MNLETRLMPDMPQSALEFDPLDFFAGPVEASGFVTQRSGDIVRTFTAHFMGVRSAEAIVIDEHIGYDDGAADHRHWHIEKSAPGVWRATAEGVVGGCTITTGKKPAACRWVYRMMIPIGKRTLAFDFEDIMVLLSPSEMMSLTPMKKFGITAARISCHYRKL